MWTRVNPKCMSLNISKGFYLTTVKDTQNLRQRYRKISRREFQIISYIFNLKRKTSIGQSNLLYSLYGVYVHNDPKRQKMPKRVKMFTSKWHRKQRHFFIHPFRPLNAFGLSGGNFLSRTSLAQRILSGEGGWIFNYSGNFPLLGPLAFWLDKTGTCITWLWGLQYKTIIGSLWYLATEEMQ